MIASVAQIVPCTEAEGPGRRFALWFQGCPLRCAGCCNPQMLSFEGGECRPVADLLDDVRDAREQYAIEGITLLGGEPLAHAPAAAALARGVWDLNLSVMVFTGFTLAEVCAMKDSAVDDLLAHTDILVDGPYQHDKPEPSRRWIGSANQSVHFLTSRYRADDDCWRQHNTIELRLRDGELSLNGFPARSAVDAWRRAPRVLS